MALMANFTQAVKEITGFDDGSDMANNESKVSKITSNKSVETDGNEVSGSTITSTMVILGRVESSDGIKVYGKVNGNIKIASNAEIIGKVIGDVDIENIAVSGAIKGDISARGNVKVAESAVIVGDIKSENIVIDGKIKGNLSTKESTNASETALVAGDIVTGYLVSDKGSIISGKVTTNDTKAFSFNEDKLFNIGE